MDDIQKMTVKHIDDYAEWLNRYEWEVMLTVRIPPTIPLAHAQKHITEDVLRPLARHLKNRIGVIAVAVPRMDAKQQHAHCLILSQNKQLFFDAPEAEIYLKSLQKQGGKKHNSIITHTNAIEFEAVTDRGACSYLAKHMVKSGSTIFYYDKRLLDSRLNPGGFTNGPE